MSYHPYSQHYTNPPLPPPPPRPPVPPISYYPGDESSINAPAGAYNDHTQLQASSYIGYERNQAASTGTEQPHAMGPRPPPRLPNTPQTQPISGQQQQYAHRYNSSLPGIRHSYNPQRYIQPPESPSQRSPPVLTAAVSFYSSVGPQPYNPAAYRDTDIANVVNQIYGPTSGSHVSNSLPVPLQQYASMLTSPPTQIQSFDELPTQPQYIPRLTSGSSDSSSHPYAGSAPLPLRPFQNTLPGLPPRESSLNQRPPLYRHSSSTQDYCQVSSLRPSPSPDFRDDPSPSIFEDPIDYSTYMSPRSNPEEPLERVFVLGRHPQSRPLPSYPTEDTADHGSDIGHTANSHRRQQCAEDLAQEDLFNQVESAVMGNEPASSYARHIPRSRMSYDSSRVERDAPRPLFAPGRARNEQQQHDWLRSNGYGNSGGITTLANYDEYSDDSDAEAAAGLEAMRMAEEQEAADVARRRSIGGVYISSGSQPEPRPTSSGDQSSDDDYGNIDMDSYGGGYEAHMSYGSDPIDLAVGHSDVNGFKAHHRSVSSGRSPLLRNSSDTSMTNMSMHGTYGPVATVDESGMTGGLVDPTLHRRKMSFDEGDERAYLDEQPSEDFTPDSGTTTELFYLPSTSRHRPLPPPPLLDAHVSYLSPINAWKDQQYGQLGYTYPVAPDAYVQSMSGHSSSLVPRSNTHSSHSPTPQLVPPVRARTDAEERKRQTMIRASVYGTDTAFDSLQSRSNSNLAFDLPTLPTGKRFQPSKLTQTDFDRCTEPWALSSLVAWVRTVAGSETELREHALVDALVALFTCKVTNMNIAEAEVLSARVVKQMFEAGTLAHEEEWLKFGEGTTTGVIYQLTGKGCYGRILHETDGIGRCYSRYCQRTVRKLNLKDGIKQTGDWATYYKLTREVLEKVDRKEVERQNVLHEIVQTEEHYRGQLNVLKIIYREALDSAEPSIIAPKKLRSFLHEVFGKLDAVREANEEYLLPQLKYRQKEQGPFIVGFSDIFRDWIRKAKTAYIDYAANFPNANFLMRQEEKRNMLFASFLEAARNNKMSDKLSWDTYLKAPITRLQRYGLLLSTVHRSTLHDSEEKTTLQTAVDEIKAVTLDCDSRVAEMGRKTEMSDLAARLILRPEMKRVELNLSHWGRKLFYKGDLQRTGSSRFTWLETHAILFDNFLVLAKTVFHRDSIGGPKYERYDVSKMPIPMELLILESTDDDPVVKSSVKGIGSVSNVVPKTGQNANLTRTGSSQSPGGLGTLTHSSTSTSLVSISTNSSGKTLVPVAVEGGSVSKEKDEKAMYPFRIKHLGKEAYTLFAPTAAFRKEWCDKIIEAKTEHAASLFAQNAEPFRLRVMADSAFAYDTHTIGQKSIMIKGTPLSRAIKEVERTYANAGPPAPICRARVNCATTFNQPSGKQVVAIGTDYGVYVSEIGNPRGWTRAIPAHRVTQIAVLEEFKLFLLISDKSLIAYHLDIVCPPTSTSGTHTLTNDSTRKAPQKLSGARDVGFFATGRMKDRTLIFYKKREGLSSTFKILEPILQKATAHKTNRLLHRSGTVDSFREYDDFYIPTDCTALDLFSTSLAVATTKGFEVLNLDKKNPWTVPDLKAPHVATIAARLRDMEPLAMFKHGGSDVTPTSANANASSPAAAGNGGGGEFLCVYEECAVYINKHGDISRSVVLEFVGKAKRAALEEGYLVLFDEDFVEVRDALNGRLKQVVAGRDVRWLDGGRGGIGGSGGEKRSVKFALQHPEMERTQIVVELVLNEGKRH